MLNVCNALVIDITHYTQNTTEMCIVQTPCQGEMKSKTQMLVEENNVSYRCNSKNLSLLGLVSHMNFTQVR